MKLFSRILELRDINAAHAAASQKVIEEANAHGAEAEQAGALARERLEQATRQADRLTSADVRNHYSESLTHAFRGSTA